MKPWEEYQTNKEEMGPWVEYDSRIEEPKEIPKQPQLSEQAPQRTIQPLKNIDPLPEANVSLPSAETMRRVVPESVGRPVLEYGGMAGGAAVGLASPTPGGTLVGGGLGYASGKKTADILYGKPSGTIGQELYGSAKDVATGATMEMGGQVIGVAMNKVIRDAGIPVANAIGRTVRKYVEKGIKPGAKLQKTYAQTREYYQKTTEAITDIVKNKKNLKLTNETGDVVGGLPTTVRQVEEAIYQGKQSLFKQYHAQTARAGEFGISVDLKETGAELIKLTQDKVFQDFAPEMVTQAAKQASTLLKRGSYTPLEAEQAIKVLNESLEAFYANPSVETFRKASIDKLQADFIRKSLAKAVDSLGDGYQALKNTYGAYAHIEKDITRRARAVASKTSSLMDLGDVFSGYHALRGVLSLNPATFTAAIGSKGIAWLSKFKSNPDRLMKKMFNDVEKLLIKSTPSKGRAGREFAGRSTAYITENGRRKYFKIKE